MGDVFINLRALMFCIVIFEYLNQKRKVIRRMHGDDLEYFLYTDCKVENLAGEVVEYLKVGSEIIGGNNCKQEMLEIFGQTQIPDKSPPSFLFTPCSSGGWGDKKVLG